MDVLESLALESGYALQARVDISSMNSIQISRTKNELNRLAREVGYKLLMVPKKQELIVFSKYSR